MKFSRRTVLVGGGRWAVGSERKTLIVDAHCHVGKGQVLSAPWTARARIDVTLQHMAEAGIDKTIIFPVNDADYRLQNQQIAEYCRRFPGKFIGFAKHDPETEQGRIRDMLRYEIGKLGLRGLKLHKLPTREVLDAVAELGIPVLYHAKEVSMFNGIARDYPQVTLIMAHLGCYLSKNVAWHLEAIAIARKYANVFLETSGVHAHRFLEMAVQELGPERVIFGSDGPGGDSRLELYKIKLLKLAPADEAKVLGGNIQRLLPGGSV